jgi:hypothetical protein
MNVAVLARHRPQIEIPHSDATIRQKFLYNLQRLDWPHTSLPNVTVTDEVVGLRGITRFEAEHRSIRLALNSIHGFFAANYNWLRDPSKGITLKKQQIWQHSCAHS